MIANQLKPYLLSIFTPKMVQKSFFNSIIKSPSFQFLWEIIQILFSQDDLAFVTLLKYLLHTIPK